MEPDVVVQWGDLGQNVIAPLENAGLKVAGMSVGTQHDVDAWAMLFATLLGKPERGSAMVSRADTTLKKMQAQAAKRPSRGPSILYFIQFSDGLEVATTEAHNQFYIELVGARNAASTIPGVSGHGQAQVDREQVLAWDPDIILLGSFDDAMPDDVYSNSVWKDLSATRTRRVYKVPLGGYRWDPPSQESPLMWRWLSDVAFPRHRSRLRDEIVTYYQFLYGRKPTNTQIDTILMTDANGESADYDQFDAT